MTRFQPKRHWQAALLYVLATLGGLALLAALVIGLRLIPPKTLTIAAGKPGSAYYDIASKYQRILAEDGISLTIVETSGSADNRELMDDPESGVDIALIQGGIITQNPALNALAAVFPEPLLVFAHKDSGASGNPFDWSGKRVALGTEGSGTRAVVSQLAERIRAPALSPSESATTELGGSAAATALQAGDIDLAFFVAPLTAPYLQALYEDSGIVLLPLAYSQALATQLTEAHWVELYAGAVRYHPAYPAENIPLVTLVAKLVARDDLHPALVNRLVHAMVRTHGGRETLVMSKPFPNTALLDMPADVYAAKLLREGFSSLENILPYWIVAQFNRFAILLLPIIFLLLPLFKLLPALLAWRMQSRVYRYYDRLHEIDLQLAGKLGPLPDHEQKTELARELDRIEAGLRDESLPLKYRERAYIATEHVSFVRRRLDSDVLPGATR